jgi:hypothetical protein
MKSGASLQSTVQTGRGAGPASSAGPAGVALTPPAYGIGIADRQAHAADGAPVQCQAEDGAADQAAARSLPNRTGLPDELKSGIEQLSGITLDDVRVHFNSPRPAGLQALAFTQGAQIHVAPGQEHHLPHEAWHVVQQKQGRVRPTVQLKGTAINDNEGLEREAEVMGRQGAQAGQAGRGGAVLPDGRRSAAQLVTNTSQAHPALSAFGRVVQRATTNLRFDKNVTGHSEITATQHNRSGVHSVAFNWVLNHGAWKSVPQGEVCNHSRDYDAMAQNILNAIHDEELTDAADTLVKTHGDLAKHDKGIGDATSTHRTRMQNIINNPTQAVNVDNVIDSFNYYIYKICDYPANLFYWPARTGANPDEPTGQYDDANPGPPWEVSNPLISKNKRLTREKKRLEEARDELQNALP